MRNQFGISKLYERIIDLIITIILRFSVCILCFLFFLSESKEKDYYYNCQCQNADHQNKKLGNQLSNLIDNYSIQKQIVPVKKKIQRSRLAILYISSIFSVYLVPNRMV